MKFAFIMNELSGIDPNNDTTVLFIEEALRRKHEVYWLGHDDLGLSGNHAFGSVQKLLVNRNEKEWWKLSDNSHENLESFDAVFMRHDPPFDIKFLTATYVLDFLAGKTFVMNRPSGIRLANEKIYSLNFPEFTPATIVTSCAKEILAFLDEHKGKGIIKPLNYGAGHGIFMLRDDDLNLMSIIEKSTENGSRHVIVQEFLKEVTEGDKRIVMFNGKPVGSFLRIPKAGELRSNTRFGSTCKIGELSSKERSLCDAIGPSLVRDGLYFVGLDVIGGYLTEVNVTSPSGIHWLNRLNNVQLEGQVIDFVESSVI